MLRCAWLPPTLPTMLGSIATSSGSTLYAAASNLTPLEPRAVSNVGGSQAHLNMQPFPTISFCIALQGLFPSPN